MKIQEILDCLNNEILFEDKKIIAETPFENLIDFHHGLGTHIRNRFKLWHDTNTIEIGDDIVRNYGHLVPEEYSYEKDKNKPTYSHSIFHPDQTSFAILQIFWSTLQEPKIIKK